MAPIDFKTHVDGINNCGADICDAKVIENFRRSESRLNLSWSESLVFNFHAAILDSRGRWLRAALKLNFAILIMTRMKYEMRW